MKLLLIDNDSDTLIELRELCDELGYDVVTTHCTQLARYDPANFEFILLSGGYWYDDELKHLETYAAELDLIRHSPTPILGICLGMQLMHVAFSGLVPLLDEPQSGTQEITLTDSGQQVLHLPQHLTVHKNHTRGITSALAHFDVLGFSKGHLEVMQHKTRPLLGVQFHPEIGERKEQAELFRKLVAATLDRRID